MSGAPGTVDAIATLTLARTDSEAERMARSLRLLDATGLPLFVVDGGSVESFVDTLRALDGATVVSDGTRGVWPQAGRAIVEARRAGARRVLYTEPDKHEFFRDGLPDFLEQAEARPGALVLACRGPEAWASFPRIQQRCEAVLHEFLLDAIELQGDFSYGPFVVDADQAARLDELDEDLGWGWRIFLFASVARSGGELVFLPLGSPCPPGQRDDTPAERRHRTRQLSQNLSGLVRAMD